MSLKIKRQSDTRVVHACTHNLADIPNGVTVSSKELIPGTHLKEGSAIGLGSDGLYHVVKTAEVLEAVAASGTAIKVAKGHHFKAGDFVMAAINGKAYAISAIDTTSDPTYDTITIGTAIGAVAKGAVIMLADAEHASSGAAFKYTPKALTGDHYDVKALENHLVSAVTIGQFKQSVIPPISDAILSALKGIVLI